jgi:hypothetical protein
MVPVPPTVQEVLDRRCKNTESEWIFPSDKKDGPRRDVKTAFDRAKRAAGLENFRFHDISHTAISYQVLAGVDFFSIAQLAGHTTPSMIETRYGHLSPRHREATSFLFGSYMDRLTGLGATREPQKPQETPIVEQVAGILGGKSSWPSREDPAEAFSGASIPSTN